MELEKNMTDDMLPPALQLFLKYVGILEKEPGTGHTQVTWPEEKEDLTKVSKGWRPSYQGEEPPF